MRVWMAKLRGDATQAQVAARAGITQHYYSMIESGLRRPGIDAAMRLAAALGTDWKRFYEDEGGARGRCPLDPSARRLNL